MDVNKRARSLSIAAISGSVQPPKCFSVAWTGTVICPGVSEEVELAEERAASKNGSETRSI